MPRLIETPEQDLQHLIGHLIWENTALKHQVERLSKQLAERFEREAEPKSSNQSEI